MPTRTIAPVLTIALLAVLLFTAACSIPQIASPAATLPTTQPAAPPTPQPLAHLQPLQPPASTIEPPTTTVALTATTPISPTSEPAPLPTTPTTLSPTTTAQLATTDAITTARLPIDETATLNSTAGAESNSTLVVLEDIPVYPEAIVVENENPIATALAKGIQQQTGNSEVEFQLATVPNEVRFEEIESFYGVTLAGWRQDPHTFHQETGSGMIEGRNWTLRSQQFAVILFSDPTGNEIFLLTVLLTLP